MAITVVVGRPGQGKSVWLVGQIQRWCRRGYNVYTNVEIKDPKFLAKYERQLYYVESLEDLINVRTGKVVLDEVQTYLNSRNWDKLDVRFQLLLQQHRKRGLDIYGATQSIKRADTVFRELVQFYLRIGRIFAFRIPFTKLAYGFFWLCEYDPDDIDAQSATKTEKRLYWLPEIFFADDITFRLYDTTQEYAPVVRVGQKYVEHYVIAEKKVEVRHLLDRQAIKDDPPIDDGKTV